MFYTTSAFCIVSVFGYLNFWVQGKSMLNQFTSLSILLSAVLSKIKKGKPPDFGENMSLKKIFIESRVCVLRQKEKFQKIVLL